MYRTFVHLFPPKMRDELETRVNDELHGISDTFDLADFDTFVNICSEVSNNCFTHTVEKKKIFRVEHNVLRCCSLQNITLFTRNTFMAQTEVYRRHLQLQTSIWNNIDRSHLLWVDRHAYIDIVRRLLQVVCGSPNEKKQLDEVKRDMGPFLQRIIDAYVPFKQRKQNMDASHHLPCYILEIKNILKTAPKNIERKLWKVSEKTITKEKV